MMNLTAIIESSVSDPFVGFKTLQKVIAIFCICIPVILLCSDSDNLDAQRLYARGENNIGDSTLVGKISPPADKPDSLTTIVILKTNDRVFSYVPNKRDFFGFRRSISHYAGASNSYIYGLLYGITAMLFITNGFIYSRLKNNDRAEENSLLADIDKNSSSLNILIGCLLIAIVFVPLSANQLIHYLLAGVFFALNIIAVVVFRNHHENTIPKITRYIIASVASIAIIGAVIIFKWFPNSTLSSFTILWGEWLSLAAIATHLYLVAEKIKVNKAANLKKQSHA